MRIVMSRQFVNLSNLIGRGH